MIAVLGPTGSGKSELALRLAAQVGGEIVNCDSLQIYRHFNIGTAKLSFEERRGIPHHLIDIIDAAEPFTAGDYARLARPLLREIRSRGRVPIVAGGTGFYFRALMDGLFEGPPRDEELRRRLEARETRQPASLHRLLRRLDAASAGRIHANDTHKLIRALEVFLLTSRPLSTWFETGRDAFGEFQALKLVLAPPRPQLHARINLRCEKMFRCGLVEEVRGILAMGHPHTAKPFEAIGYRQALQVVQGRLAVEEAVRSTQAATRQYAKRQLTWFRREAAVRWLEAFGDEVALESLEIPQLQL